MWCRRTCRCHRGDNSRSTSIPSNKILPVIVSPSSCDFLEIRPNRRIRVIHIRPWSLANTHETMLDGLPPKDISGNGSSHSQEDQEGDEDYWFENAAPKRMPIQAAMPRRDRQASRIINKFEPQSPPRIPGIKPPRSSRTVLTSKSNPTSPSITVKSTSSTSSPSANGRLPRKKILATEGSEMEDEEDEDCIYDLQSQEENDNMEPIVQDNFVADVLADMSGMVLSLTADVTDGGRKNPHFSSDVSSPKLQTKRVESEPDPEEENLEKASEETKVIVEGGHLGGRANVAFESDEDKENTDRDEPDAGYSRLRDNVSDFVAVNLENSNLFNNHMGLVEVESKGNEQQEESSMNASARNLNNDTVIASSHDLKPLPVLFFIHGVGGSASTWTKQIEYFAQKGYEVVAPDLLGHGFSSVPDNAKSYTFSKLFRDIITIFDHYIGQSKPCVIIAHSYGCSFAIALARSRPQIISSLVLIASGGPTPLAPPPVAKSLSASILVTCLKPFLRCGFRRKQKYNPRGKTIKFQEALDIPSYVFRHILAGQSWPEGKFQDNKNRVHKQFLLTLKSLDVQTD